MIKFVIEFWKEWNKKKSLSPELAVLLAAQPLTKHWSWVTKPGQESVQAVTKFTCRMNG